MNYLPYILIAVELLAIVAGGFWLDHRIEQARQRQERWHRQYRDKYTKGR